MGWDGYSRGSSLTLGKKGFLLARRVSQKHAFCETNRIYSARKTAAIHQGYKVLCNKYPK
jgi:hypothetical protein